MNKVAIISSNGDPEYELLVPLCVKAWKHVGFDTLVMRPDDNLPSTSQIMRLFGPLEFPDDTMCVMGDADLIPLSREFFDNIYYQIFCVGADLLKHVHPTEYPMCYTGALTCYWKQFMPYDRWPGDTSSERARSMFRDYQEQFPGCDPWSCDQVMLAKYLSRFPCEYITRGQTAEGLARGRYDRANDLAEPKGMKIDIHARPRHYARIVEIMTQQGITVA